VRQIIKEIDNDLGVTFVLRDELYVTLALNVKVVWQRVDLVYSI
jgi:hypothetical protein